MSEIINIIQHVTVRWYKDYKEASKATIRNKVPETFVLPNCAFEITQQEVAVQQIYFSQGNEFVSPESNRFFIEKKRDDSLKYRCINLQEDTNSTQVLYNYSSEYCGLPLRYFASKKIFFLEKNQYGKLVINGRFVFDEGACWYYEKQVFNILRCEKKKTDFFLSDKPKTEFRDLHSLYRTNKNC